MKIASFNFRKINIEKFSDNFEKVEVTSNIDIKEIAPLKQELFKTNEEFIDIKFNFVLNYEPKIAKIELAGDILLTLDPKQAKNVLKEWKDEQKIQDEFRVDIFNIILRKAHIKAIELEDELNLPIHMVLPMIKKEEVKN